MIKILKILFVLFTLYLFAFKGNAQNNVTAKGIMSYNTDSAAFKTTVNNAQNLYNKVGALYYNTKSYKWRVYEDSTWHDLLVQDTVTLDSTHFWLTKSNTTLSGSRTVTTTNNNGLLFTGTGNGSYFQTQYSQGLNFGSSTISPLASFITNGNGTTSGLLETTAGGSTIIQSSTSTVTVSITSDAATGHTFLGKALFTPTATKAGVNVGLLAGDPSSLTNGDVWYNSTSGLFKFRQGGTTVGLGTTETASNGLTKTGNNIALGGAFNVDATIQGDGFSVLNFTDLNVSLNGSGGNFSTTDGIDPIGSVNMATTGDILVNAGNDLHLGWAFDLYLDTAPSTDNTQTNALVRNGSGAVITKTDFIDGTMSSTRIPIGSDANTLITDTDLTFTGGNTLNTAELAISGLPAASGILFNNTVVDNEGAFTYNPTGNVVGLLAGQIAVTNVASTFGTNITGGQMYVEDIAGTANKLQMNVDGTDGFISTSGSAANNLTVTGKTNLTLSTTSTNPVIITGYTSSSYSPTITGVANVASTASASATYSRTYNNVTVYGILFVDPTTVSTSTQFRISLPIASAITSSTQANGLTVEENVGATVGAPGYIVAVDATNDVIVTYICADASNHLFHFQFQYTIL